MRLRTMMVVAICLLSVVGCAPGEAPPTEASDAVLFEGARLIVGDDSGPIENSAFIVENGRFTAVGSARELELPAGGTRVDLRGKTVMPAIVDLHYHAGYTDVMGRTAAAENYSRENLIDQLNRARCRMERS